MIITAVQVLGTSGKTYTVKADVNGVVHCTCPAWRFQHAPVAARTCKHVEFVKGKVA